MIINRYNIEPGTILWYRKRDSWDVDCLTVKEVGQYRFTFTLKDGTEKNCTYEYASGRLYKDRSSLSTYRPRIEMVNTYDGWSGKPISWGDAYDVEQLIDRSELPEDDEWVCRALQHESEEAW